MKHMTWRLLQALTIALGLALLWAGSSHAATGTAAVECFNRAKSDLLSPIEATKLCSRMNSVAPAECYRKARHDALLDNDEAVALCECAESTAAVDCYTQARTQTTLSRPEALKLCMNASSNTGATTACRLQLTPYG